MFAFLYPQGNGMRPSTKPRHAGFTLVELMVVIAIIAVLAAIILPVYTRTKESARQTTCKGNLYAIAIALRNYSVDSGGYPLPYEPVTGLGGITQLYLSGYLDSAKVLRCPDDHTTLADYNKMLDGFAAALGISIAHWSDDTFKERYSTYNQLIVALAQTVNRESLATDANVVYPLYNYYGYYGHTQLGAEYKRTLFGTGPSPIEIQEPPYNGDYMLWTMGMFTDPDHTPNYDASTGVVFDRNPSSTYARPLWDLSGGSPGNYTAYTPALMNSNAPDYTIITHCPWHRGMNEGKDLVVRLGGDTGQEPLASYDWVVQKAE